MRRQSVSSSNLASVGYDLERQVLEVQFRSGGIYQYSGVPYGVYTALLNAPSKGRYFAHAIRDRFTWRQIN